MKFATLAAVCFFSGLFFASSADLLAADALDWDVNYPQAMAEASRSSKMLLVLFYDEQPSHSQQQFDASWRESEQVRAAAAKFTLVKLPIDAVVDVDGKPMKLLDHGAFAELRGSAGLAIIDLTDPASKDYRQVVSVFPFSSRYPLDEHSLLVMLDLPAGSLTQRTLIFAVRTHPEHPASAEGQFASLLADETRKQADYQASITMQGHQNWESRFQLINRRLANGMVAQEVCAESWPGQGLFDAAIECVHSWRQSSGHWDAVRSRQPMFGYDMKRGRNGVWYATGIFAHRI